MQAWLVNHIAQKKGLGVGHSEAGTTESADAFTLGCLSLADEKLWKMLTRRMMYTSGKEG